MRKNRNKLPVRERVVRWLYPAHCALCDRILNGREKGLCAFCRQRVRITGPTFENGIAAFPYRGVYRDSVKRFKYSGRAEYAAFFAKAIAQAMEKDGQGASFGREKKHEDGWRPDVLVPVPVHRRRFLERGYNQAEELARELGKILRVPCEARLVVRVKNTKPQNGLAPEQRKANVKNAFAVRKGVPVPEKILLVDDIYTTGSTRKEMERILYACGVREVRMVCICLASPSEHI